MRNAHIDRLRGMAILLVLVGHSPRFIGEWSPVLPTSIYEHLVIGAYYGVTLFFVASGFLITSKFVNSNDEEFKPDLRNFYIERIGRIIPPLFLLFGSSLIIQYLTTPILEPLKPLDFALSFLQFDFGAAAKFIPHTDSSLDALWSLRVEETFYVFLPILLLIMVRKKYATIAAILLVAIGFERRFENNTDIHSFFTTVDQLAIGCLVAAYAPRIRTWIKSANLTYLRLASIALIAVLLFETRPMDGAEWCTLMALGAAGFIIASPSTRERSPIVFRPLESFGRLSYEIYLFHMMVFWALTPVGAWSQTTGLPRTSAVVLLVVAIGLCGLLGHVIAKAYSEPLNRRIRHALSGIQVGEAVGPSPVEMRFVARS